MPFESRHVGLKTAQAAKPRAFNKKAWIRDYACLKAGLERTYSNLAWFASPQSGVDLPALNRRVRRALESAETEADAKAAMLDFIAGFQDGHLRPVASLQAAAGTPMTLATVDFEAVDPASGVAAMG